MNSDVNNDVPKDNDNDVPEENDNDSLQILLDYFDKKHIKKNMLQQIRMTKGI